MGACLGVRTCAGSLQPFIEPLKPGAGHEPRWGNLCAHAEFEEALLKQCITLTPLFCAVLCAVPLWTRCCPVSLHARRLRPTVSKAA
jgi:hypothetical protein